MSVNAVCMLSRSDYADPLLDVITFFDLIDHCDREALRVPLLIASSITLPATLPFAATNAIFMIESSCDSRLVMFIVTSVS